MKKLFLVYFSLLFTTNTYAFFCPTNMQNINFGDSLNTVIQQCGQPYVQKKITANPDDITQEWVFNKDDGTAQTRFVFSKQRIISITENGFPVSNTTLCGNTLSLNDTLDTVKKTCPAPTLINKNAMPPAQTSNSTDFSKGTVEFYYETTPPMTLIFIDGILKEKK